ncbi:DUF433 domain-containing protein [Sandaracinobacteroides saxicola]|uniref:DUF433 domain-containing protein n=1 Tax=Sandaracinobacteroides saxicola TaxID=2759707 RepID=A0A7G5IEX6_9SPHN|nr:DUF433 domain-containing protein [Sandaracinobacteroides saxicola]QMW21918.1 DUF433 domain-containing protein [Sandaracinobacteroides saxicola]
MVLPDHPLISVDPEICGGKACLAGSRMRVVDILEMLAEDADRDTIVEDFPYVTHDHIRACLAYAADVLAHPVAMAAE